MQAAPFRRLVKCRQLTASHTTQGVLQSALSINTLISSPFRALRFYATPVMHMQCAAGLLPAEVASALGNTAKRDFVPPADTVCEKQLGELHDFIVDSQRLLVVTGAGISTESGIPDYRSPQGAYSKGFKPITHQAFLSSASTRRRYWARSYIGWRRFVSAVPGTSHLALARLESRGRVGGGMITQNVDRLHHAAGSKPIELHGTTHRTICLECGEEAERSLFQDQLKALNREWASAVESIERGESGSDPSFGLSQRPDGDVEVEDSVWSNADFQVPPCALCGGVLKPDVVFFGDNVPKHRAASAHRLATECDSMLVVGSSLMVLSAFRLAKAVHERGRPITLLNVGPTRADDLATLKIEAGCGEVLSRILAMGSMDVPLVA